MRPCGSYPWIILYMLISHMKLFKFKSNSIEIEKNLNFQFFSYSSHIQLFSSQVTRSHCQWRKSYWKMLILVDDHLEFMQHHSGPCPSLSSHTVFQISDHLKLFVTSESLHRFSSMHGIFFSLFVGWVVYHLDFRLKPTSTEKTSLTILLKSGVLLVVSSLFITYITLIIMWKNNSHIYFLCSCMSSS